MHSRNYYRPSTASHLARQLKHQQREPVAVGLDVVHVVSQEVDGDVLGLVEQEQESVPPRRHVCLGLDKLLNKLGAVGKQLLAKAFVNAERCQRRVAADVRVTMFQARLHRRDQRLQNFVLFQFA
jgi:hypothetical protein